VETLIYLICLLRRVNVPPTRVEELQKAGIIAEENHITAPDVKLINSLTRDEVKTLIRVKNKLGVEMLKKTAKGNKFPHPDSISF
jgi:hypothetical protein